VKENDQLDTHLTSMLDVSFQAGLSAINGHHLRSPKFFATHYKKAVDPMQELSPARYELSQLSNEQMKTSYIGAMSKVTDKHRIGSPFRISTSLNEGCSDGAVSFSGEKLGEFRHGVGHLVLSNGDVYDGEFRFNVRKGHGVLCTRDGKKIYEGEWSCDLYQGKGTLHNVNNETSATLSQQVINYFDINKSGGFDQLFENYTGDFINGHFEGHGVLQLVDGTTYSGEFRGGSLNGKATLQMTNGERITGEWRDNCLTQAY
jgi:hypothetical protein